MSLIFGIADTLILLFIVVLFARVVIDLVQVLARDWRPKGFWLVVCEAVYTVTDPPLRFLRRVIPPLTIGRIRFDLAFLVLLLGCYTLSFLLGALAQGMS